VDGNSLCGFRGVREKAAVFREQLITDQVWTLVSGQGVITMKYARRHTLVWLLTLIITSLNDHQ
jgi:hypothetical protein